MSQPSVFISHASNDDIFVKSLRQTLEKSGAKVWADSRQLIAGDVLQDEILQAITVHDYFFIVVSPHTFESEWVKKELEFAKSFGNKRIVTLLLDGQSIGALSWMFEEKPLAIQVSTAPGGLQQALPEILAALKLRLPDDAEPTTQPPEPKVNDLLLVLENPMLYTEGGLRRGQARAHFEIHPADAEKWETDTFNFICPLGPIEAGRMKWYIEDYPQAPFLEKILDRGAELEREMAKWGKQLFDALTDVPAAREMFWEWRGEQVHERRFSVKFNFFNEKDLPADQQEAVSLLMATPWEILHDGQAYLFQGKKPVRVRRQLPNKGRKIKIELQNKLRILLLSPRPVDDSAGYIDHRVAPKALLAATEMLGDRAELTLLTEPTFSAMCAAIDKAEKAGQPFSVVHFDGHGVFDAHRGLGALCFESNEPGEQRKLEGRKTHLVYADELLAALRDYRIPFFFLDACQSAVTDKNPTASVAATLLETGVASVAAMSYSVLVKTAEDLPKPSTRNWRGVPALARPCWRGSAPSTISPCGRICPKAKNSACKTGSCPSCFRKKKTRNSSNTCPAKPPSNWPPTSAKPARVSHPKNLITASLVAASNCWPSNACCCSNPTPCWSGRAARARPPWPPNWPAGCCAPGVSSD